MKIPEVNTYSVNPSSFVPFPLGPCPQSTSTDGAYCFVTQLALPGPSEILDYLPDFQLMYFMLASRVMFSPNF